MKKTILYFFLFVFSNNLKSSSIYSIRPPQEVSFLGQEVHQAYGTTRYHENPYDNPVEGIPVDDDYLVAPSPRTPQQHDSNRTTISSAPEIEHHLATSLISPRTSTSNIQNNEHTCRKVTIIFLSTIGIGFIIGTTYYLYKSLFNYKQ